MAQELKTCVTVTHFVAQGVRKQVQRVRKLAPAGAVGGESRGERQNSDREFLSSQSSDNSGFLQTSDRKEENLQFSNRKEENLQFSDSHRIVVLQVWRDK